MRSPVRTRSSGPRSATLPRRQAQAIALRYVYGLDIADIADTLGISNGSAKVHLYRGRQALATRLGVETDREEER